MADSRLYVHVLLDRSGSMESCRQQTIDAFNSYVANVAGQAPQGARLSLTIFDSESIDHVYLATRIADVPTLTHDTFVPRGSTPLFDAVAKVVSAIDKVTLLPDERVAFIIVTDGQENASREMTAEAVRKMIADRQERGNWLVQYLGANQDAWAAGAQIGVGGAHSLNYAASAIAPAMASAAASVRRFSTSMGKQAYVEAAFTDEERAAAQGRKS